MTTETPAITWRGVSRSFKTSSGGETRALVDFTLDVPRGSIFGLLGRNGCGKSTALQVALGLLRPESGEARLLDADSRELPADVRRKTGYLSEAPFEYDDIPIPHLLRFLSAFFPKWDAAYVEALRAKMRVPTDKALSEMSVGVRRRSELFLALAPRPELLVLDDPWLGVDAVARRDVLTAALDAARDEGVTVLFTSHVLTDVERGADRVAVMRPGKVLWNGALDDLKAACKRLVIEPRSGANLDAVDVPGLLRRETKDGLVLATTAAFDPDVVAALRSNGHDVVVEDLNLEAAFVEMTADEEAAT
jgi:ABC-2 type transport system ATP-binding protein